MVQNQTEQPRRLLVCMYTCRRSGKGVRFHGFKVLERVGIGCRKGANDSGSWVGDLPWTLRSSFFLGLLRIVLLGILIIGIIVVIL